jgi:hypothetical protein
MRVGLIIVVTLAALSGCVTSGSSQCADLVCPTGTTCAPAGDRCVDSDLVAACRGLGDGEVCNVPGLPPGSCLIGVCQASRCGDGRVTGSEDCDGADFEGRNCQSLGFYQPGGLACTSECRFDSTACVGRCGDGIKNGPERCDGADLANQSCFDAGYYAAPGLACAADCTFDTAQCGGGRCGDGIRNGLEQCDQGAFAVANCAGLGYFHASAGLSCTAACTYAASSCTCAVGRCTPWTQRCSCDKAGCACIAAEP